MRTKIVGSIGGNYSKGLGKELGKKFLEWKEKQDNFGKMIIGDDGTETD
jgi:phosphoribosylaminoimidazole-succinocarboxamide synthase